MDPKENKKAHLVETAAQLFYEQGYQATGVKQIIETAGIAKGTFYSHFKSKEDLGIAWLQSRHIFWTQWLESHVSETGMTPVDKIAALFSFLKEWMRKSDFRGCAFLNTMAETPDMSCTMRKEVRNHKRNLLEYISRLVREATPDETEENQKNNAQLIYLLFEAALIETQNFGDCWPIKTAKNQALKLLNSP